MDKWGARCNSPRDPILSDNFLRRRGTGTGSAWSADQCRRSVAPARDSDRSGRRTVPDEKSGWRAVWRRRGRRRSQGSLAPARMEWSRTSYSYSASCRRSADEAGGFAASSRWSLRSEDHRNLPPPPRILKGSHIHRSRHTRPPAAPALRGSGALGDRSTGTGPRCLKHWNNRLTDPGESSRTD